MSGKSWNFEILCEKLYKILKAFWKASVFRKAHMKLKHNDVLIIYRSVKRMGMSEVSKSGWWCREAVKSFWGSQGVSEDIWKDWKHHYFDKIPIQFLENLKLIFIQKLTNKFNRFLLQIVKFSITISHLASPTAQKSREENKQTVNYCMKCKKTSKWSVYLTTFHVQSTSSLIHLVHSKHSKITRQKLIMDNF